MEHMKNHWVPTGRIKVYCLISLVTPSLLTSHTQALPLLLPFSLPLSLFPSYLYSIIIILPSPSLSFFPLYHYHHSPSPLSLSFLPLFHYHHSPSPPLSFLLPSIPLSSFTLPPSLSFFPLFHYHHSPYLPSSPPLFPSFLYPIFIISLPPSQESDVSDIFRQAVILENTYSHFFDHNLHFSDVTTAMTQVMNVVDRMAREQQWVPAAWLETTAS